MARTIGVKYKNLIKKLIKEERAKGNENPSFLTVAIRNSMPVEAWDTWECADQEINSLIDDEIDKVGS